MRTAALAARTVSLRGVAVRVRRIMPVPYSPLTAMHGQDRDDGLAEVDPGQADLGRVVGAAPGRAPGGRGRRGADD